MQWRNIELRDGIANLDVQLSNEPVIGKWLITVTVEGKAERKQIEISKYDIPMGSPSLDSWKQHCVLKRVIADKTV